ncbi:MAG: hypothetical protein QXF58_05595 [Desulfurococcaceae archaeon]
MGILNTMKQYWRLSGMLYKELVFQSTHPVLQSLSNRSSNTKASKLVNNAMVNVFASKVIYSIALVLASALPYLDLLNDNASITPQSLSMRMSSTVLVAVILFLFAGIQEFSSIGRVKFADFLLSNPITVRDASALVFLAIMRAYDIPVFVYTASSIAMYILIPGSMLGLPLYLVTVFSSIILALSISLYMGVLFSKIVFGERSVFKRLLLLIMWIMPYYMIYFLYSVLPRFYMFLEQCSMNISSNPLMLIIYPFPFTELIAHLTLGMSPNPEKALFAVIGLVIYVSMSIYIIRWINTWIKGLLMRHIPPIEYRGPGYMQGLKPRSTYIALILKDLRLGLRNPGVFLVLTMPIGFTVVYWVIQGVSHLLIFLISIWITLFYTPVLFFIEQYSYIYLKTLPLDERDLVYAKVLLASIIYALMYIVLLILTSLFAPWRLLELINMSFTLISNPATCLFYSVIGLRLFGVDMYSGNIYSKLGKLIPLMIVSLFMNSLPWAIYISLSIYPVALNPLIITIVFSSLKLIIMLFISHLVLKPKTISRCSEWWI